MAQNMIVSNAVALHIQIPSALSVGFLEEFDYININIISLFSGMHGYANTLDAYCEHDSRWTPASLD